VTSEASLQHLETPVLAPGVNAQSCDHGPRFTCKLYVTTWVMFRLQNSLLTIGLQVVRCFEDEDVHHVNGKVDPAEDAETINFELALADVAQIEKRLERLKKGRAKTKEEQASNEVAL